MTDLQAYAIKGLKSKGIPAGYSIDLKCVLYDPKKSYMYQTAPPSIVRQYARIGVIHDLSRLMQVEWRFMLVTYTIEPNDTGYDVYTTTDGIECISRYNTISQVLDFIFDEDFSILNS